MNLQRIIGTHGLALLTKREARENHEKEDWWIDDPFTDACTCGL